MNAFGFTRRSFIGSLSAAMIAPRAFAVEEPLLRFGVLSDCHIRDKEGATDRLEAAFRHLGHAGCRLVAITGDLCEIGTLGELSRVADAWKKVFPTGVNSRGERIELTCCWGNHDYHDASYLAKQPITDEVRRTAILYNKETAWRLLTGEQWAGEVSLKKVGGVTFVLAHWQHLEDDLEKFLSEHADEIPSDAPVFLFQHSHPRRTCFGKWYQSSSSRNFEILMKHPNLFVFSGHSHISCGYDDALWQGGFVSMAAGCASSASGRRYEYNVQVPSEERKAGKFRHMPPQSVGDTFQASVVAVYPSRVLVSRFDLRNQLPLGADIDLAFPFEHDRGDPLKLASLAPAPQFPAKAEITVEYIDGVRYPDHEPARQLRLRFPCARSTGTTGRVVDYRVEVFRKRDGAKLLERLVAQSGAALAEEKMLSFPGECVFGVEELPREEEFSFVVTPLNAGGRSGTPLMKG